MVAWNRVLFPEGSITLGAMPGSDQSGHAGYSDQVDNHYFRIFGSAVLMSLMSGGMACTMDLLDTSNSESDKPMLQNGNGFGPGRATRTAHASTPAKEPEHQACTRNQARLPVQRHCNKRFGF